MPSLLKLLAGYGLVGLLNSVVGWAVIFGLDLGGLATPPVANAAGFAAGIALGFALHRRLFEGARTGAETARYFSAVAAAFALNQAVLTLGLHALGSEALGRGLSQLLAIAAYSGVLFLLCRTWVFQRRSDAGDGERREGGSRSLG